MPAIALIPEFIFRLRADGPLPTTKGSPLGERNYWIINAIEIEGPRIRASLAAPGSDWLYVGGDRFLRPDARAALKTDDGATVLMHNTGLIETTDAVAQAMEANGETRWEDQYLRLALRFETGAARYRWLNESLFIARGRFLGIGNMEFEVFRVG